MSNQSSIRVLPRVMVAGVGLPLGAIAELWLAFTLGTTEFGAYAWLLAISRLLAAIVSRGSEAGIVRMGSTFPEINRYALLRWTILHTVPLGIVVALAATALVAGTGRQPIEVALLLLAVCPLCTATMTLQGFMTLGGHTGRAIIPISLAQPAGTAVGVMLISTGVLEPTVTTAAWIGFSSWCLALATGGLLCALLPRRIPGRPLNATHYAAFRNVLRQFTLLTIGNQALARSDLIILGLIGSPAATGMLAIIVRITNVMVLGMQAAASALLPAFGASHHASRMRDLNKPLIRVRAIGLLWAIAVAVAGGLFLTIAHKYSDRFLPLGVTGWWAWSIMCGTQLIVVSTGPISAALNQTGYADRVARQTIFIAATTVVVQLTIAPFGILAIASSTMVSRLALRIKLFRIASRDRQLRELFALRPSRKVALQSSPK